MTILFAVLLSPFMVLGFLLGFISRPLYKGWVTGFMFLQNWEGRKLYKQMIARQQYESDVVQAAKRLSGQEGLVGVDGASELSIFRGDEPEDIGADNE